MGYTRLAKYHHWMSDVVMGALLGIGTGFFVIKREEERERKEESTGTTQKESLLIHPTIPIIRLEFRF